MHLAMFWEIKSYNFGSLSHMSKFSPFIVSARCFQTGFTSCPVIKIEASKKIMFPYSAKFFLTVS